MRKSLAALCLLIPYAGFAAEKPPEIASLIQAHAPIGEAHFNKLLFHVYDASFWSDHEGWSTVPYALSITYGMNFTTDDVVSRTVSEMSHVSGLSQATIEEYGRKLSTIWPAIHEGDRITAVAVSRTQTVFYDNGKKIGQVDDANFGAAFFGIWLSEKTSEPAMREQLLHR